MERLADARNVFAQVVVARAGCPHNRAVLRAFAQVPRHDFLGPGPWIDALAPGGRLVFPLVSGGEHGAVFVVRREPGGAYSARMLCRARFVPCIGAQDDASRAALEDAFRGPACEAVRSLRIAPEPPDRTAWFAGDGWWLSTAQIDRVE